ncbi:MAG: 3-dehydroquinate synthase [Kiritimatiellia bacterium]|nr:3-dehydroquinate synthase [Kiritimatiellia bacterium]
MDTLEARFSVPFRYPVTFTRSAWKPENPVLCRLLSRPGEPTPHRFLTFVDSGVAEAHPRLIDSIRSYATAHSPALLLASDPVLVPGGEAIKNDMEGFRGLLHKISRSGLCRHSTVVAIGGGAVLDAVGFATSLVHRGLRLLRMPTTVLAQNDAGIGVKNGMNTDGGKNSIGVFAPPFAVVNDFDFLRTLDDRNWISGVAEAFKVAILKDAPFFRQLTLDAPRLRSRDAEAMERLIRRCAQLHLEHITGGGDPFEMGSARPLDFGHWAAHRIESLSDYRVAHGEAVAIGIALDSSYAARKGWIDPEELEAILRGLLDCGLPIRCPELDRRDSDGRRLLFDGLRSFREHLGGELCVTFPQGLGGRREEKEVDTGLMDACIEELASRNAPFS